MTGRRTRPSLHRTVRLLQAARAARSVAQGVLAVDFALYLKSLHWSGAAIGSVLAGGLIFGVVMTIAGSIASDRIGRKRFLLGYDAMFALACAAALVTTNAAILGAAAIVGAFGRGANGSAGPFATLESAWLAQGLDPGTRSRVLSHERDAGIPRHGRGRRLCHRAGTGGGHRSRRPGVSSDLRGGPLLRADLLRPDRDGRGPPCRARSARRCTRRARRAP